MDQRILLAAVFGLLLAAFGGFYVGLSPRFDGPVTPPPAPPPVASAPSAPATPSAPPKPAPPAPSQSVPATQAPAQPAPAAPPAAPPPAPATPPPQATAASVEAEMAASDYAELQALLKSKFPHDYSALIAFAVRRKNQGASDRQFGQEMYERIQDMLRAKLKFGTGATMPTIDRLAANEKALFHTLGTTGSQFCLQMLGKGDTSGDRQPPEEVRRLMNLGTLYRFQAIAEGMPEAKPVEPLRPAEMKAFEAALAAEGLDFKQVSSGAYLNDAASDPGKPCLTLEKLHRAIATLPEPARRKIYAGMFFLGRDK